MTVKLDSKMPFVPLYFVTLYYTPEHTPHNYRCDVKSNFGLFTGVGYDMGDALNSLGRALKNAGIYYCFSATIYWFPDAENNS